jgi:hypothetical protein
MGTGYQEGKTNELDTNNKKQHFRDMYKLKLKNGFQPGIKLVKCKNGNITVD